jgi:hypothetical protein
MDRSEIIVGQVYKPDPHKDYVPLYKDTTRNRHTGLSHDDRIEITAVPSIGRIVVRHKRTLFTYYVNPSDFDRLILVT